MKSLALAATFLATTACATPLSQKGAGVTPAGLSEMDGCEPVERTQQSCTTEACINGFRNRMAERGATHFAKSIDHAPDGFGNTHRWLLSGWVCVNGTRSEQQTQAAEEATVRDQTVSAERHEAQQAANAAKAKQEELAARSLAAKRRASGWPEWEHACSTLASVAPNVCDKGATSYVRKRCRTAQRKALASQMQFVIAGVDPAIEYVEPLNTFRVGYNDLLAFADIPCALDAGCVMALTARPMTKKAATSIEQALVWSRVRHITTVSADKLGDPASFEEFLRLDVLVDPQGVARWTMPDGRLLYEVQVVVVGHRMALPEYEWVHAASSTHVTCEEPPIAEILREGAAVK